MSRHAGETRGHEDRSRLGGGLALKTPFGVFYAPNISSDKRDGIGDWTDAQIANALLSGVGRHKEYLYPVFPYTTYAHMTREDARDLIAYLRTLPAVPGKPPRPKLPFLLSFRPLLGVWRALYFRPGPLKPIPGRGSVWNRGRYLVNALAHCAECHSARNFLGAIIPSEKFAGGPNQTGEGWIPNITPGPDGIAKWTKDDVVQLLTDGTTPDYDEVGSSMADVVSNTSKLPKADLEAIADYIKSLPPRTGPIRPKRKAQAN